MTHDELDLRHARCLDILHWGPWRMGPGACFAPRRRHGGPPPPASRPVAAVRRYLVLDRLLHLFRASGEQGSIRRWDRRKELDRRAADVGHGQSQCRRGALHGEGPQGSAHGRSRWFGQWERASRSRASHARAATLRSHVHRVQASNGRCCLRVPRPVLAVALLLRLSCGVEKYNEHVGFGGRRSDS